MEGGSGQEKITAFAVHNDPKWRPRDFDDDYEKTFRKLRVSILSAREEYPGSLWVWGKSMLEVGRDDDMMDDQEALYAQFYMLPDKLKTFARDVAAQPSRPTLTLNAQGLLFRDEVDSALSELWHPREYVVIYDHHHRAILNSIRFDLQTGAIRPPISDEVINDNGLAPLIDSPVQHTPLALVIPKPVEKSLRGLKHAIWLLALAIVLAALIR